MKNRVISMLAALVLATGLTAGVQLKFPGMTEIPDVNMVSTNGYIATFWYGSTSDHSSMTALGASAMLDIYGSEYAGYWDDASFIVPSVNANDTVFTEVRVFQYTGIDATDADAVMALTGAQVASAWDLVAAYSMVWVSGGSSKVGLMGLPLDVTTGYVSVPSVPRAIYPGVYPPPLPVDMPEPSTYTAIAGLAILAIAASRKNRK